MAKKIKIFIAVLIILIAVVAVLVFNWQKNNNPQPSSGVKDMILFYGDTCPHCEALEEWIKNNNIEEKVEFSKLEVYNNQENQKILVEKATACGITTDSIGVPFFWNGADCIVGDQPIEDFLQQVINLNKNVTTNETNK